MTWKPFSLLEYEFNTPPHEHLPTGEASVIRYELQQTEDGTDLTLTHSLLTKPTAIGFAPGTHALLDRLVAHLDGTVLPNWMTRFEEVKANYPSWSPQS